MAIKLKSVSLAFGLQGLSFLALLVSVFFALSVLSGCMAEPKGSQNLTNATVGAIKVVVSIAPFKEWVKEVGKQRVDVHILIPPGKEPHTFDPTPRELMEFRDAKVFVKNGAGLEFWADKVLAVNPDIRIVDISKGASLIALNDSGSYDPHVWMSLKNAENAVALIKEALVAIDPANKAFYDENAAAYISNLKGADKAIRQKLSQKKIKEFIVFHPALAYFAKDYGLKQVEIKGKGKEPSPKQIKKVVDIARDKNITVVFVEPQFDPSKAKAIANEINGTVGILNPLAEDYLNNIKRIADKLMRATG